MVVLKDTKEKMVVVLVVAVVVKGLSEPISPFISLAVRQVRNYPAHSAVLASVIPVCNNIGMIQIFIPSR